MNRLILAIGFAIVVTHSLAAENITATIEKANSEFTKLFNKGDAEGVARRYTDDATILPAGAPMIKGNKAIEDFWQQALKTGLKDLTLTTQDVEQHGDVAFEIGKYSIVSKDGKAEGKYVVVWKERAGDWKLDTDIWNMDK